MSEISFKNFKAFGQKEQSFSNKPITLVYGANSVGKSSLLHAMLYKENLLSNGEIDLKKSNFAGDEIDFGGFDNFIHKHEDDRKIEYSFSFSNQETIEFILQKWITVGHSINYLDEYENMEDIDKDRAAYYTFPLHYSHIKSFIDYPEKFTQYISKANSFNINPLINIKDLQNSLNLYGIKTIDITISISKDNSLYKFLKKIKIYFNSELYMIVTVGEDTGFDEFKTNPYGSNLFLEINENSSFTKRILSVLNYKDVKNLHYKLKGNNKWIYNNVFKRNNQQMTSLYNIIHSYKNEKNIWDVLGGIAMLVIDTVDKSERNSIQYFSPLRFYPKREDMIYNKYETNQENKSANSSKYFWQKIMKDEKTISGLNSWLGNKDKLKSNYRLCVDKYYKINDKNDIENLEKKDYMAQLKFIDLRTNIPVYPKDMGLGISQSLPIIASCLALKKTKIFIEQPELHLHPSLQCEIADEFIKSHNENGNRFFIESHSEHLLLRIMKRLKQSSEGKISKDDPLFISPKDICLLYVDSDGDDTYVQELRLSENGKLLDRWPNGFFEEGYGERFF